MVRQVKSKVTPAWKALLALTIAAGALLWHLLACTESPMAFSPDGENLAFVTMEPYDADDMEIADTHVYRLMVLTKAKEFNVIEETTHFLLSAPAYSPDGKQLCYLRIPLLTKDELEKINETVKKRKEMLDTFDSFPELNWNEMAWGKEFESIEEPEGPDLSLPSSNTVLNTFYTIMKTTVYPVMIVVRDAQSDKILSRSKLMVPFSFEKSQFLLTYLTIKPQYSPDSQWIYLPISNFVFALNPQENRLRMHAGLVSWGDKISITQAIVSPDGKFLAVFTGADEEQALEIIQTDGQKAIYHRLMEPPSPSGIAWKDNQTLVLLILAEEKDKPKIKLQFLNTDGSEQKNITVNLPKLTLRDDTTMGELAISPNGRFLAISFLSHVYFLNIDGKILNHIHHPAEVGLVQPTYSPNSKQVAFKYLAEEKSNLGRVTEIVFFTPQGKETTRFKVPQSQFMQEAIEKRKAAQEKKDAETHPPDSQKMDK